MMRRKSPEPIRALIMRAISNGDAISVGGERIDAAISWLDDHNCDYALSSIYVLDHGDEGELAIITMADPAATTEFRDWLGGE